MLAFKNSLNSIFSCNEGNWYSSWEHEPLSCKEKVFYAFYNSWNIGKVRTFLCCDKSHVNTAVCIAITGVCIRCPYIKKLKLTLCKWESLFDCLLYFQSYSFLFCIITFFICYMQIFPVKIFAFWFKNFDLK